MSLVLRKLCQESLDKYGLSVYHTEINETSKCLMIVGECGKPLVNIHGIHFSRLVPSKEEIEYASELFIEFLDIHGKKIADYVKKGKLFAKKKQLSSSTVHFEISETTKWNHQEGLNKHNGYQLEIKDKFVKYTYTCELSMKKFKHTDTTIRNNRANGATPAKELTAYKADATLINKGKKYLKDYVAFDIEKEKLESIRAELSQCNV